jgi:hypothetical protein
MIYAAPRVRLGIALARSLARSLALLNCFIGVFTAWRAVTKSSSLEERA